MLSIDELSNEDDYDDPNELNLVEASENIDNSNEENTNEGGEGENDEEDNETKTVVKPKRVVRNPRPKLSAETLKGERGLTALESHFENIDFKGRGYEEEDLNILMKIYNHWCHRLFPKYTFDDCIAKIESLGTKRAVQTHIKRIRLNMINEPTSELEPQEQDSEDEELLDQAENIIHSPPRQTPANTQLNEEQLELIRLNKQRAENIRKERLARIRNSAENSLTKSQILPEQELRQNRFSANSNHETSSSIQADILIHNDYLETEVNKTNSNNKVSNENKEYHTSKNTENKIIPPEELKLIQTEVNESAPDLEIENLLDAIQENDAEMNVDKHQISNTFENNGNSEEFFNTSQLNNCL